MARMSIRAAYALDEPTAQRIRQLARSWGVSQAEVTRRSVRASAEREQTTLTPADVVAGHCEGPLPRRPEETRRLIESLRAWRHADDEARPAHRG